MFGDLDILSFVVTAGLHWIGLMDRMDSMSKVSQVFNNSPQGSRLSGRPRNRRWNCEQTDSNKCKFKNWKER